MCPSSRDTTRVDRKEVDAALATIKDALLADGHDLSVTSADWATGEVTLTLEALPNACLDCLPPMDVLVEVAHSAIRSSLPGLAEFSVRINEK